MNDNQEVLRRAAHEVRVSAQMLFAGHTIGGEWPENDPDAKAEHDRLLALADEIEAIRQVLGDGEAVAWVRRHPDGTLTREFLADDAIEPVRKNGSAWVPLFTHPLPAAGGVAGFSESVLEDAWCHAVPLTRPHFDRFMAVVNEIATHPAPARDVAEGMVLVPMLDANELDALKRCVECWEDGEGHDVPKEMMRRLADKGAVQRHFGNMYSVTSAGEAMLAADKEKNDE